MSEQSGHTMTVSIEQGYLGWEMICNEAANADCRMRCPGDCEENCYCETRVPGDCIAVEWIAEWCDAIEDAYQGEKTELRSPMDVEVSYEGDNTWTWTIAEPASAEQAALTSPVGSMLQ